MLTAQEKVDIRHFLAYPNVERGLAIGMGFPSAIQPLYVLQYAMDSVLPEAEDRLRAILQECLCIESQISDARSRIQTTAVDKIKMNTLEIAQLEDTLDYWVDRLADFLGVTRNPVSHQGRRGTITMIEPDDYE